MIAAQYFRLDYVIHDFVLDAFTDNKIIESPEEKKEEVTQMSTIEYKNQLNNYIPSNISSAGISQIRPVRVRM